MEAVESVFLQESQQGFASLVRLWGDFDSAEEAMQEAFAAAAETWSANGVPENPVAWLVSTGRFKAIDLRRKTGRLQAAQAEIAQLQWVLVQANNAKATAPIEDDRLRLIFSCCHPAIDPKDQVPLTLREVCGLTIEEIAHAFLASPATMAQRIVRGKAKILYAKIPITIPSLEDIPGRLDAVLSVIYLMFNEGNSASQGTSLTRVDLSNEAIRLARLVQQLTPDPKTNGLLALILLHDSRRPARTTAEGEIICWKIKTDLCGIAK